MQSATERRQMILEKLSDCRRTTRDALATEFNVSTRTIERDIEILSCSVPVFTLQGGNGGIYVADSWYLSRRYLHQEQEALLHRLMNALTEEDRATMQDILTAFAKPKPTR